MRFFLGILLLVFPTCVFGGDLSQKTRVFEKQSSETEKILDVLLTEDIRGRKALRLDPLILGGVNFFVDADKEEISWPDWLGVEIRLKGEKPFFTLKAQW